MKCPGQDSRFWQPGAIFESQCPNCGQAVEFFKDESTRRCKQCGHKFVNPKMDFGCASYCKFAEQCLGELTPELLAKREDLLKDRVAIEMKKYFQKDFKRIAHASKVARYAEEIVKAERGDPSVVLCAAYLHDIGAREALRKHQSTDAQFQEQEGPEVAREILARLGARPELITEVCDIIGHHHHPRDSETTNFKAVFDADYLANLEEEGQASVNDVGVSPDVVNGALLTDSGRVLAKNVLKFPNS
jgi:HD superfamily phosphodiesterase